MQESIVPQALPDQWDPDVHVPDAWDNVWTQLPTYVRETVDHFTEEWDSPPRALNVVGRIYNLLFGFLPDGAFADLGLWTRLEYLLVDMAEDPDTADAMIVPPSWGWSFDPETVAF